MTTLFSIFIQFSYKKQPEQRIITMSQDDEEFAPMFDEWDLSKVVISRPPRKSRKNPMNRIAYYNMSATNDSFPQAEMKEFYKLNFDPSPGLNKSQDTNPYDAANIQLVVPEGFTMTHAKCAEIDAMNLQYARDNRTNLWPNEKSLATPVIQSRQHKVIKQAGDNPPMLRLKASPEESGPGQPNPSATQFYKINKRGEEADNPTPLYDLKAKDRIKPIPVLYQFWASPTGFGSVLTLNQAWHKDPPGTGRMKMNSSRKRGNPDDDHEASTKRVRAEVEETETQTEGETKRSRDEGGDEVSTKRVRAEAETKGGGGSKEDQEDEDDEYGDYDDYE